MTDQVERMAKYKKEIALAKDREYAASYFEKLAKCIRQGKSCHVTLGWVEIGLGFIEEASND